jgi:hypothetical protein
MKCFKCGKDNPPQSAFCNSCGTEMTMRAQQPSVGQGIAKVWDGLSFKAKAWILGICTLVLIGIISSLTSDQRPRETSSLSSTSTPSTQNTPPTQPKQAAKITAEVKFSGTQFIITNKDSYAWTDVKLEINGGFFSGGYELKHSRIEAGQTYTVGALQFADSDGRRFNPYQMKPKKFSICGKAPIDLDCYVGGWD